MPDTEPITRQTPEVPDWLRDLTPAEVGAEEAPTPEAPERDKSAVEPATSDAWRALAGGPEGVAAEAPTPWVDQWLFPGEIEPEAAETAAVGAEQSYQAVEGLVTTPEGLRQMKDGLANAETIVIDHGDRRERLMQRLAGAKKRLEAHRGRKSDKRAGLIAERQKERVGNYIADLEALDTLSERLSGLPSGEQTINELKGQIEHDFSQAKEPRPREIRRLINAKRGEIVSRLAGLRTDRRVEKGITDTILRGELAGFADTVSDLQAEAQRLDTDAAVQDVLTRAGKIDEVRQDLGVFGKFAGKGIIRQAAEIRAAQERVASQLAALRTPEGIIEADFIPESVRFAIEIAREYQGRSMEDVQELPLQSRVLLEFGRSIIGGESLAAELASATAPAALMPEALVEEEEPAGEAVAVETAAETPEQRFERRKQGFAGAVAELNVAGNDTSGTKIEQRVRLAETFNSVIGAAMEFMEEGDAAREVVKGFLAGALGTSAGRKLTEVAVRSRMDEAGVFQAATPEERRKKLEEAGLLGLLGLLLELGMSFTDKTIGAGGSEGQSATGAGR